MVATGARLFVLSVFFALAIIQLAPTAALFWEFWQRGAAALFFIYSFRFLVLPATVIIALACFLAPLTVFLDMYWRFVPFGRVRILVGFAAAALCSILIANWYATNQDTALWQVPPESLARGPSNCATQAGNCTFVQVAAATREIAIGRGHVSKFARSCTPDPDLEPPEDQGKLRRCLPNGTMANAADCCKAQAAFKAQLLQIAADEKRPSLTALVDRLAMPFRAFFISTIIGTTLLLIFWQRYLEHHYQPLIEFVDLGIFLAAFTMLFAVVAEQGERLAEAVMFARSDYGVPTIFSAVLVPWSIFICLYFLQSYFAQVQSQVLKWGRVLSGVAGIAGASLLQVDNVMDVFAVVAGVAAAWFHVAGVTIAAVAIAWWMTAVSQRILRSRPVGSAA